jgi:hypothetical protein
LAPLSSGAVPIVASSDTVKLPVPRTTDWGRGVNGSGSDACAKAAELQNAIAQVRFRSRIPAIRIFILRRPARPPNV